MTRISTPRFFFLMIRALLRSVPAHYREVQRKSRLLIFILGSFIISYLVLGYWLFWLGLTKLHQFPLVGSMLSQRILFLIFGFFFVMLVFSNLIIGYSTLFKNRETAWLLTLPVSHRAVYCWKFFEALIVSSWALMFLSAPMMLAYGETHDVSPVFYVKVLAAYAPFIVIPALIGSCAIVFLARVLARASVKKSLLAAAGVMVLVTMFAVKPVAEIEVKSQQDAAMFDQLLRHTRVSVSPLLPSAWLAQSITGWSQGLSRQGTFFFLVLLSNALMGIIAGYEVIGRFFYGSWTITSSSRAERFQERAEATRRRENRGSMLDRAIGFLPMSKPVRALVLKDMRVFWRDPAQWTQFAIFFGLLCIYVLNLRNVAFTFHSDFWEPIISHLNLGASSLTLSTLTTRFVFPQFSLEGRRLWILGLAPIKLQNVLLQKYWLSFVVSAAITVGLMVTSSVMLHLPMGKLLLFAGQIAVMSATLCGVAVGLGALFPNLKEDNPSKIVSGFGGTLCLVVSFIYITFFIALSMIPALRQVMKFDLPISTGMAISLELALSAIAMLFPMIAAMRRMKSLEF